MRFSISNFAEKTTCLTEFSNQKILSMKKTVARKLVSLLLMFVGLQYAAAQQLNVKGTVTDPSGEPVIGASVMVEGTKTGTSTDIDGVFTVTADAKGKLRISYIGYEPQEVAINGRKEINIIILLSGKTLT